MKLNPLKITDTTFRDAHQSILATRMKTEDMVFLAKKMDKVGFYSMEVWGGATFDVCLRFLNEDPWERLRKLKKVITRTPLQMLLRGQNLVGYRHYADDVVQAFVFYAADCGIDIFRIFDALNDERNLATSLKAVKDCGRHAQLALCYSITKQKLGGPVYNIDYFVKKAEIFQKMGADSICLKDMAGLLAPDDAYKLIRSLKKILKVPLQLHTHCTSGMALMACLKAIEAGVDMIDTALSPLGLRSSQPAVEPMVVALEGTDADTGLDLAKLIALGKNLERIVGNYREFLDQTRISVIDADVLFHQIPGGMTTNLINQLREINALDKWEKVLKEIPRVRREFGYPPLVTPTSQIIGVQAIQNVLLGRYKLISQQARDYLCGFYGQAPSPVNRKIQKIALKGYKKARKPITLRPADLLKPEIEKAIKETKDMTQNLGDILIQALYDKGMGMDFLKRKYQKEG